MAQAAPRDVSSEKLRKTVTLQGLQEHLEAFQAIGSANGNTRATGTPGYEASVEYVIDTLEKAGYRVTTPLFNYPVWRENTPARLTWGTRAFTSSPSSASGTAVDMITFGFAQSGTLTNLLVVPTNDIVIHSGASNTSTSGCEMGDFPAATAGNIALIQRGTCPFVQKLANAEEAGAAGVILFNEGNDATRVNPQFIEGPFDFGIPAVYVSATLGREIYAATQQGPVRVSLTTDTTTTPRFFRNVVAYSDTGDPDNTVMLGAHLDSVPAGPGVNDNESGSSALLEIAEGMAQLAKNKNKGSLTNRVAFAFWGAEESGLVGSTYFVENLSDAEKADIMANLNFDMLASPNFARLVYDGDGSSFGTQGPEGSDIIEHVFNQYFASQGLAYEGTAFTGPLGLRAVHRRGHPCRRPVHRCRGAQDGGSGRPLRRRPGRLARPVLPPGVRHAEHPARLAAGHRAGVHPATRRPAGRCRCRAGRQRDGGATTRWPMPRHTPPGT